jgi:hypothetical protein
MKRVIWIIFVLWIILLSWCSQNTSPWMTDTPNIPLQEIEQTDEIIYDEEESNTDITEEEEAYEDSLYLQNYIFGEEFNLKYWETIYISDTDTKITFSEVLSDSRCPSDVQCFWAWEANIVLLFSYLDSSSETLEISFQWITGGIYSSIWNMSLEIQELSPYPQSSEEILLENYSIRWIAREASYEPFLK